MSYTEEKGQFSKECVLRMITSDKKSNGSSKRYIEDFLKHDIMSRTNSLSKKALPLKKEALLTKLNAKIYFWSLI